MLIGRIQGFTRELGKPKDWDNERDGHCEALPILDVDANGVPAMVSAWYPTPDEAKRIAAGEPVYLWIFGRSHPPVSLSVAGE